MFRAAESNAKPGVTGTHSSITGAYPHGHCPLHILLYLV